MKILAAFLFFALPLALRASEALELAGHLVRGSVHQFTIRETASKTTSGWLALGDSWEGYIVESFDPTIAKLTIVKGAVRVIVGFRPPTPPRVDFDIYTTRYRRLYSATEPKPNKAPEPTPGLVTPRALE